VPAAGLNAVPPASLGKAAGVLNTMQLFGATIGIATVAVVFNAYGNLSGPAAVTDGFRPSLTVAASLSVLGALAALGIRRSRPAAVPAQSPIRAGQRRELAEADAGTSYEASGRSG
jgi:hypothetical protein